MISPDKLRDLVIQIVKHAKLTNIGLKPSARLTTINDVKLTEGEKELVEILCSKYQKMDGRDSVKLLRIMLKDFALLANKSVVLEKTPNHVYYLSTIQYIFPKAKICHIIRDGRNVAASYIHPSFTASRIHRDPLHHVCRLYAKARQIDRKMQGKPNYLSVRYETLLERPEDTFHAVFDFLNLPFQDMLPSYFDDIRPTTSKWDMLSQHERERIIRCLSRYSGLVAY